MTNINGKAYAMNAITPMKPWKTPILKLVFFILGAVKPLQKDLKNLSFIHFARWVCIGRTAFPRLSDTQPAEQLKYDYLLFFSNFNGTWNQYIDAFSAVLYRGLDLIWRWSERYPGSRPVTGFKRYISLVQFDTDYYYNVYPHSTTNDVKAALRVKGALETFAGRSAALSPAEFEKRGSNFTLGWLPISALPVLLRWVHKMANVSGGTYGLTILSPIREDDRLDIGHAMELRWYLSKLPRDYHSPFAQLSSTYLARLVVLDDAVYVGLPACEEHLKSRYLVFETNFDGDLDTYLRRMATETREFVNTVWGHCVGFPGTQDVDAFISYMKKCQIETTFFFADVNDATVESTLNALRTQSELARFIETHQGMAAAELQGAFAEFLEKLRNAPSLRRGGDESRDIPQENRRHD